MLSKLVTILTVISVCVALAYAYGIFEQANLKDSKCDECWQWATDVKPTLTPDKIDLDAKKGYERCMKIADKTGQDKCLETLKKSIEQAIYLMKYTPLQYCQWIGACPKRIVAARKILNEHLATINRVLDATDCERCLDRAKEIKSKSSDAIEIYNEVSAKSLKCKKLAISLQSACLDDLSRYVEQAYYLLDHHAIQYCQYKKMCLTY